MFFSYYQKGGIPKLLEVEGERCGQFGFFLFAPY